VTFAADTSSWVEILGKPFRPFDSKVWVSIGLVGIVVAIVYYIVERDDFEERDLVSGLIQSLYETFFSLVAGGVSTHATVNTHSGRVLQLGFAFFILLVISTYTAELTNYLITNEASGQIKSLQAAIGHRKKICGPEHIRHTLERLEPGVGHLWVNVVDMTKMPAHMDAGECDVAILMEDVLKAAHAGVNTNDDRHCNKIRVGQPIISIPSSIPVRAELQQAVSWAMDSLIEHGTYDSVAKKARGKFVPHTRCASAVGGKMHESSGLTVKDMLGVFSVTLATMLASLLVFFLGTAKRAANGSHQDVRLQSDSLV